jgi:hypothetical protein
MTYASLEEAYGGISGSNYSQLVNREHPAHKKQNQRRKRVPPYKTVNDRYQCQSEDDNTCQDSFKLNQRYNDHKKHIAQGTMPPMYSPGGIYLPQYPWPTDMRNQYLYYSPMMSGQFYNPIHQQHPDLIGPYYPDGFFPGQYVYPPAMPPQQRQQQMFPPQEYYGNRVEHFTPQGPPQRCYYNPQQQNPMYGYQDYQMKLGIIISIFILCAIAIITCCALLCKKLAD